MTEEMCVILWTLKKGRYQRAGIPRGFCDYMPE